MTMLPFTRPSLGEEEFKSVQQVLESGWLTSGPRVTELEQELSKFIGGGVTVRMFNSATSVLEAVLIANGIGPGDEVIVPAMSFVASANVVLRAGATPVFAEVELQSRNVNVESVKSAMSSKTRAVIPVHFSGMPVDMQPLYELATASNILVLEDAAQAIGTSYKGEQIGSSGNPVAFSFHPNKNMTTIEGGAIACRDDGLIKLLESIRFHGIDRNESGEMMVEEWGGKMNMPDVCASVGLAQLQKLAAFNQKRRTLAQRYFDHLPRHPAMVLPADADGHSWHMFCICLDFEAIAKSREEVISEFRQQNIMLGIHYPAIHLFGLYQRFGYGPGDFPVAERIGQQTLTLPLFPAMTNDDVDRVCGQFRNMLD